MGGGGAGGAFTRRLENTYPSGGSCQGEASASNKEKKKKEEEEEEEKKKKKKKKKEKEVPQFYIYKLPIDRPAAVTGNNSSDDNNYN